MPGRAIPLVTDHYYHVFNRGIDRRTTFAGKKELQRAIQCIEFYQYLTPPVRLSRFLILSNEDKERITDILSQQKELIKLIAFTLMPNHFHLLVQQCMDGGISKFMGNVQNSYTRYFNTIHERKGPLFEDQFQAVIVETDEQLIHLSRYIHLNPYTSYVVKTIDQLLDYPWSSLREYLGLEEGRCLKEAVLGQFRSKEAYKKFVLDQANYQRRLEKIKHLTLETEDK